MPCPPTTQQNKYLRHSVFKNFFDTNINKVSKKYHTIIKGYMLKTIKSERLTEHLKMIIFYYKLLYNLWDYYNTLNTLSNSSIKEYILLYDVRTTTVDHA